MTTTAPRAATDAYWRMISQTAEYALRVVLYLAARPPEALTAAPEAARAVDVTERYLARVLNALVHAGVLRSVRGAHGGFRLARRPAELTLAQVVAPFDAVGDPPQCLLRNQRCGVGEPCLAHAEWHTVATAVRGYFHGTTIADLLGAEGAPCAHGIFHDTHTGEKDAGPYRYTDHDGE
jgi:Rrf2 family protein